jgi:uncharacterized protein (TIGR03435 family)
VLRAALFLFAGAAFGQAELPSFEVASLKRSPSVSAEHFTVTMDDHRPGIVTYRNVTLLNLLMRAYHLEDYQIKAPGWVETEEYDIVARVPANTPFSQRRLMLRRLLAERLQLRAHLEKKDLPAYVLLVGKSPPTLRKAKPQTVAEDGTMAGSLVGGGSLDAKAQTMQGLANMLSNELRAPVADQTGIKGQYDLLLTWGSDDDSVATALERETGLVLKKRKAILDFLVVDHIEKTPAAN